MRAVEGFNILKTLYFNLSVRRAVEGWRIKGALSGQLRAG